MVIKCQQYSINLRNPDTNLDKFFSVERETEAGHGDDREWLGAGAGTKVQCLYGSETDEADGLQVRCGEERYAEEEQAPYCRSSD